MAIDKFLSSLFGSGPSGKTKTRGGKPAPRSTPADTVVYAIGDIHGRLDKLLALEGMIEIDAGTRPAKRRVLVYLGDYVDRGPDSQGVVEHLALSRPAGFEVVHLIGNHERLMLDFLNDAEQAAPWFANGGLPTLASYGLPAGDRKELSQAEILRLQDGLRSLLPARHRTFLKNLRSMHREGDFVFVHAGIRPGIALEEQKDDDLVWIRQPFLSSTADHGYVVVHGHTITEDPEFLTALAIEGGKVAVLQTSP
jgi:serine/threonine protein phosphatase 1